MYYAKIRLKGFRIEKTRSVIAHKIFLEYIYSLTLVDITIQKSKNMNRTKYVSTVFIGWCYLDCVTFFFGKGQTKSKCFFQADVFLQKTKKRIKFYYYETCFCSIFGGNWRHQKDISKLTDLYQPSKGYPYRISFFFPKCTTISIKLEIYFALLMFLDFWIVW